MVIGWIRNNLANKIYEFIKCNIDKIIHYYYKQLQVILAPNLLNSLINTTNNENNIYFSLLIIYGYWRINMKTILVNEICHIILNFYHSRIMNDISFRSWSNALITNGIILAYGKGTPYFIPPKHDIFYSGSGIKPYEFMYMYQQYLDTSIIQKTRNELFIQKMMTLTYKDEINYSSFTGLYCDKINILHYESIHKLNKQKFLCTKYDQNKYAIFSNSQQISFQYYRRATIVFDIIWSLIWCL